MTNETNYDGRTILRWIRACFQGDSARFKRLRIRVSYGRGARCLGCVAIGGSSFHLTLPRKPENLTAPDLSFVLCYLYLLHRDVRRRDMTMAQKTPGVRPWHANLPLPAFRSKTKEASTAAEKTKMLVERRAQHAKTMLAKYELLESTCAAELLRLGKLKKTWAAKVGYYEKKGF